MVETLVLGGVLKGHTGCVTAIACSLNNPDLVLSSSRDKSTIVWRLEGNYGYARRRLTGHLTSSQDVVISSGGQFTLPGSWKFGPARIAARSPTMIKCTAATHNLWFNVLSGVTPSRLGLPRCISDSLSESIAKYPTKPRVGLRGDSLATAAELVSSRENWIWCCDKFRALILVTGAPSNFLDTSVRRLPSGLV